MQISDNSDITVNNWVIGDPAIQQSMDICIYGLNVPSLTTYAITVSSSPSGYKIANTLDATKTIDYTLFWDDGGYGNLGASSTQMTDGVKLTLRQHPNILLANCGGGDNARLTMKITQAAMTAARSGTYQGTISLLLTPN